MEQYTKKFSTQLNKCLDDIAAPAGIKERAAILGKILHIPKQQAWGLLEGQQPPTPDLLKELADEFEVEVSFFKQ